MKHSDKISDWIAQIDIVTAGFSTITKALSTQELNQKPNANAWSIAQIMDHLITINNTYFPILKLLHEGNYKSPLIGRISFIPKFIGKEILKSVQPAQAKKIKTFSIWEPQQSEIIEDIFQKFEEHQERLKHQISASHELLKTNPVISSPANKNIVYRLATAFEIIVTHEQRHLAQAERLKER